MKTNIEVWQIKENYLYREWKNKRTGKVKRQGIVYNSLTAKNFRAIHKDALKKLLKRPVSCQP